MNVVIDTNVFIVSISKQSSYRPIFESIISGKVNLLVSSEVMLEYEEKITEKSSSIVANNIIDFLNKSESVLKLDVFFKWNLILTDYDDNKFSDLAIRGNATYLVTDDKHFEPLKNIGFPKLKIISAKEFLQIIK